MSEKTELYWPAYAQFSFSASLKEQLMDELPLFYPQIKDLDCAALGGLDEEKKVVVEKYLLILQTDTPLDKAQLEKIEEWASRIIGQEVTAPGGCFREFPKIPYQLTVSLKTACRKKIVRRIRMQRKRMKYK